MSEKKVIELDEVVIKFSGDSGDGMQLTGTEFSNTSVMVGEDVATFPDYPAEIRAPQGTVGGVSGFQLHFGAEVSTPGDFADVLVAMNPAALKANMRWIKPGGTIILDIDSFTQKNLEKAGYTEDPLKNERLGDFAVIEAPITSMSKEAVKDLGVDNKSILRSKNMFALGMVYWLFGMPMEHTEKFFIKKFGKNPLVLETNKRVLNAGYNYAENLQFVQSYRVKHASVKKGTYRNISGNTATAWGLVAAAEKANLKLFCGSYPITPATEIFQELTARKDLGVNTLQCEDEIAGICTSIGASFAGNLAVTSTSGPGLALKTEAIGLAVIAELPLVIVNVQRGGPSTGLPTKTEQADLMQAVYGRNGECPVVVLAAGTPSNCFKYAYEACRIALEHMMPVILLTDGYIANGSQPWRIPLMSEMPEITPHIAPADTVDYKPYRRFTDKLIRQWAIPGTPGLEHRIGGLEKMAITGTVSYVPENHEVMVKERAEKVIRVANHIPAQKLEGEEHGDVLVVGWGGTYGHLHQTVKTLINEGKSVSLAHFNYINPLPLNTGEIFARFKKIIVCEINMGQFANHLRINFPQFNYIQYNKVQGLPFTVVELQDAITKLL